MKIALCTELRNMEWFESRLRSLFDGDGQLAIDELWNENQLAQALRRSRYHAVVIAMTGARGMNFCMSIRGYSRDVPLLWISDQAEFEPQSRRMQADTFLVKPVTEYLLREAVSRLL